MAQTLYAREEFQQHPLAKLSEDMTKDILVKFSNKPSLTIEEPSAAERERASASSQYVGILETKRIQNIEIMLRKFNNEPSEIAKAVRTLDPKRIFLSDDNVDALSSNTFKEEELVIARAYTPPEGKLAEMNKAEALAYHVARVPRFTSKVTAMLTMRSSDQIRAELKSVIGNVLKACIEVRKSEKFHGVLASVLAIGNFLNEGTAKGEARGFKVEALLKLSETRTSDRKLSLLHYLVDMMEEKAPNLLDFPDDLSYVRIAKRAAKEDIAREVAAFKIAVEALGREVQFLANEIPPSPRMNGPSEPSGTPPPPATVSRTPERTLSKKTSLKESEITLQPALYNDKDGEGRDEGAEGKADNRSDYEVARECFERAEEACKEISDLHAKMVGEFAELAILLGEEPRHAKTEDMFSTLDTFMKDFTNCLEENRERKQALLRKERMEKKAAEMSKTSADTAASEKLNGPPQERIDGTERSDEGIDEGNDDDIRKLEEQPEKLNGRDFAKVEKPKRTVTFQTDSEVALEKSKCQTETDQKIEQE